MPSFHPWNTHIVIVRYTNDVSDMVRKLHTLGFHVIIYEKHPHFSWSPYFVPLNKGNEASGYLKYIIDHYDAMPEYVVFIHDHEYSWHHQGNIVHRIQERIGHKTKFENLNSFLWTKDTIEWFPEIRVWYARYLKTEVGSIKQYGDFMTGHLGCAQFIVHRDKIQRISLSCYVSLYYWILNTNIPDYYSGRFLEYTWHLMWGEVSRWNGLKQRLWRALGIRKDKITNAIFDSVMETKFLV